MSRKKTLFIVLDCSYTTVRENIGRRELDRLHRGRGFLRCGYHCVIRRDGTVESGRPVDVAGACVKGYNDVSVQVCLIGGQGCNKKPASNFTAEQRRSLTALVAKLSQRYPNAEVVTRSSLPETRGSSPLDLTKLL